MSIFKFTRKNKDGLVVILFQRKITYFETIFTVYLSQKNCPST